VKVVFVCYELQDDDGVKFWGSM